MMSELVSVVTPAHNSAAFISDAIQSVSAQTYTNWEHVIVDDGSRDGTWEIVEAAARKDRRIRPLRFDKQQGAAAARNKGIQAANGRFIAFLDSDDQWLPEKLERQLDVMQAYRMALSYTAYEYVNEAGERQGRPVEVPETVDYETLLDGCVIGCLTAMYDAQRLGKRYMPDIRKRQDYGLWLDILKDVEGAVGINEVLAQLRVRPGSLSSNKLMAARYQWKVYREVEGLPLAKSMRHFGRYILHGIGKYSRRF